MPGKKPEEMIEITGADLVTLVKNVYKNSAGQWGSEHKNTLTDDEAKEFINESLSDGLVVEMDFVNGRECNFFVKKIDGRLFVPPAWYCHTDAQFWSLLKSIGSSEKFKKTSHLPGCSCADCKKIQK